MESEPNVNINSITEKMAKNRKLLAKIATIIGSLIVLQLPLLLIQEYTQEREKRNNTVQQEFEEKWGKAQTLNIFGTPDVIDISTELFPEVRYRGIYQTVLYTAQANIKFKCESPREVTIRLDDHSAVKKISIKADGKEIPIPASDNSVKINCKKDIAYDVTLIFRGSNYLNFNCSGVVKHVRITGKWDSPSFTGETLADEREISAEGFSAVWNEKNIYGSVLQCGVCLKILTGPYQKVLRCVNYATFFLFVFFFTLVAGGIISKTDIHPLQFVISSAAPVLFYLTLLATSEHIGFLAGYILSSTITVLLVSMYARLFTGKNKAAAILGLVFAASYVINYIILQMEHFALLSGTAIMTLALAVSMCLTGKINRKTS